MYPFGAPSIMVVVVTVEVTSCVIVICVIFLCEIIELLNYGFLMCLFSFSHCGSPSKCVVHGFLKIGGDNGRLSLAEGLIGELSWTNEVIWTKEIFRLESIVHTV